MNGILHISNCSNLHRLEIGNHGFENYQRFELSNVHSLQSISVGDNSFFTAQTFSLKSMNGENPCFINVLCNR